MFFVSVEASLYGIHLKTTSHNCSKLPSEILGCTHVRHNVDGLIQLNSLKTCKLAGNLKSRFQLFVVFSKYFWSKGGTLCGLASVFTGKVKDVQKPENLANIKKCQISCFCTLLGAQFNVATILLGATQLMTWDLHGWKLAHYGRKFNLLFLKKSLPSDSSQTLLSNHKYGQ